MEQLHKFPQTIEHGTQWRMAPYPLPWSAFMKRLIADLIYQVLAELLSQMLMRLADWLAALPWL